MKRTWMAVLLCIPLWVPALVYYPVSDYRTATFRDPEVRLLASPFKDSPVLRYEWSGDVFRGCPISIDREMVDNQGVVWTLKSSPIFPAIPDDELGMKTYKLSVETPVALPEGPGIYQAYERPRCTWLQRLWPPKVPYPEVRFVVTK